jgi:hypothetical protein
VVDGSNLATEGRTVPSLKQLDEAVRAYAEEDPGAKITVVVDASFEHRIAPAERETVRDAMLNGEVVSPPAGAIGRGDAFVLRIAERTGAVVVSNDSFQEFHGEHPWLFEEGRLVGGKPVRNVGWIFTPRLPIRGPKSRAATKRSGRNEVSAPAKAAELAKAAKKADKAAKKTVKAPGKKAAKAWPLTPVSPPPSARRAKDRTLSSAIDDAVAEALEPAAKAPAKKKADGAKKKVPAKKAAAKAPAKAAKAAKTTKAAKTVKKAEPAKKKAPVKKAAGAHKAAAKKAVAPTAAPLKKAAKKAAAAAAETDHAAPSRSRSKRRQGPPPAVNEPLSFINFVGAHSVGSTVQGTVVSFTSHGAMVDVAVPKSDALHCYIPLSAMGTPPPVKARQVLKKGEVRSFVLAALDTPRRVAELALPAPAAKKRKAPAKRAAKASS